MERCTKCDSNHEYPEEECGGWLHNLSACEKPVRGIKYRVT